MPIPTRHADRIRVSSTVVPQLQYQQMQGRVQGALALSRLFLPLGSVAVGAPGSSIPDLSTGLCAANA
eukprot:1362055-Rhodomonas_salina.1